MAIYLHLDDDEAKVLREMLERELSDMSVEIAGTDRKEYREEIKSERRTLRHIFERLQAAL